MKHDELAAELFCSGCNCAQAVFGAFCDVTGMEKETALRLASSFGAGMGRMRETCGAVTGMFMVLGMVYGGDEKSSQEEKGAHYARVQELAAAFRERHGTIKCSELLEGLITDTSPMPEARAESYYKARPCVRFVVTAAKLLDDYLAQHPL